VDCFTHFERYSLKTMTNALKKQSPGSANSNLYAVYRRVDFQDALGESSGLKREVGKNISFVLIDVTAVTAALPHRYRTETRYKPPKMGLVTDVTESRPF